MTKERKAGAGRQSVEYEPSGTAMGTATLRALSAYDERERFRGPDSLAEIFLSQDRRDALKDPARRNWVIKNRIHPGMYEFMIARTAFFDGIVAKALQENIPQIVFLGAGYDSRPYRFRGLIRDTRIYELDIRPTQQRKKEILQQAAVPVPEGLVFLAIDFKKETIGEVLNRTGYSSSRKTLFIWEGVCYYLDARVVDEVLGSVKSNSAVGSLIGFDYASLVPAASKDHQAATLGDHMKSAHPAEPTKFGVRAGEIESFLRERGYRIAAHYTAKEMEARFLSLGSGSSAGKIPSVFSFVLAEVSG